MCYAGQSMRTSLHMVTTVMGCARQGVDKHMAVVMELRGARCAGGGLLVGLAPGAAGGLCCLGNRCAVVSM